MSKTLEFQGKFIKGGPTMCVRPHVHLPSDMNHFPWTYHKKSQKLEEDRSTWSSRLRILHLREQGLLITFDLIETQTTKAPLSLVN